ncbi:high nitrogen upregulated cytochrome P450 monooxygenase 2 [Trametes coccinea BRFM310]|uniref:High nitrogen upregulated cytochrome P450 monooxygenase 2 n=1 Tax=Trametes coccinea (strain BRFM310) TaxID=1353009 RepID=A0A1Y2I8X3_TRAC3|nr:high nitrogen upregulated cytochrome P450 monooxygenase 2 [Trametes coccinea BRFM310]
MKSGTISGDSYHSAPSTLLVGLCVSALVAHQGLKRLETYSISTHLLLIGVPPVIGVVLLQHDMLLLRAVLLSFSTFFLTLLISTALYRLSPYHPLARYPGPIGCKLSKFWMASLAAFTGRQHLYLKRLHERYGDVVRIGPNELSFRDPSVLDAMLGVGGVPKGPLNAGRLLSMDDLPLVAIMDPAFHAKRRKPWTRAFSIAALKEYEPTVAHRVRQLVQVLQAQSKEVIIGKFMNYFAYDVMCDVAFGGGSELLRDGDSNNVWHIIEDALLPTVFMSHVPYLGLYVARLPGVSSTIYRLLSYSKSMVLNRIKRGSERKDIFHYLNHEDQPDMPPPPVQHLLDDGVLAVVAGSDTTASALTSLAFCLLAHPHAMRRLQEEVDRFYPAGENACDPKSYRDMHYLTAVINETLRLYPPIPGGTQRQVPHHGQAVMLGSYFVPPGTAMYLHPYSLQRDPRNYFPFPEEFWPERWLVASQRSSFADALKHAPLKAQGYNEDTFKHNESAFLPFAYGPANCVGKGLAMLEMRMVLCALLQKFELRLREGWDVREYDKNFLDYFVTTKPDVPVVLHPRF